MTPGGWREAAELQRRRSSARNRSRTACPTSSGRSSSVASWATARCRPAAAATVLASASGHGAKQAEYADWKASLFANIGTSRRTNAKGAVFHDVAAARRSSPSCATPSTSVASKVLSDDYLKAAHAALARDLVHGRRRRSPCAPRACRSALEGGSGRSEICVEAMSPGEPGSPPATTWPTRGASRRSSSRRARPSRPRCCSPPPRLRKLHALVAPFVHPSMAVQAAAGVPGTVRRSSRCSPLPVRISCRCRSRRSGR